MKRRNLLWALPCLLLACTGQVEIGDRGDGGGGGGADAGTDTGLPCCQAGQEWGGLPGQPQTCEGCCAGLSEHAGVVGPGDLAYSCTSPGDAGNACVVDSDCRTGELCGFAVADACTATGECFVNNGSGACQLFEPGCACDGTTVNLACNGLPDGYAAKPVAETGACSDGGVGSTCQLAGGVCTGNGGVVCAVYAPASAQDCNPTDNPAGSFCCVKGDAGD